MAKTYLEKLKLVEGKPFVITKVHPSYRFGWEPLPWEKVMPDGSKVMKKGKFRSFYKFPIDARLIVHSGDKEISERKGEQMTEYREQFWDSTVNKFGFRKMEKQQDYKTETEVTEDDGKGGTRKVKWMKLYKKVFDVEVQFQKTEKFTNYKGEEVETDEAVIQHVSSTHIKSILETFTDATETIKKVPRKDRMGNPTMDLPFDWEDGVKDKAEKQFLKLKVIGSGMETKYVFQPSTVFAIKEAEAFGKGFGEEAPKKKSAYVEPTAEDIQDLPF